jgi:Flp pilus assembly protein TadD
MTPARLALVALALFSASWTGCRNAPSSQAERVRAAQQREAAYRANNRGVALMEQESYAGAAIAFREALTTDPGLRLARINLPIALYYAGQLPEATQAANDARRDVTNAPQPPYMLGLIARAQGQPQGAVEAFTRVLLLDPSDVGSRLNLAMIRLTQGQYQEVITLCRAVLADEPYNATAAYNLALALDRSGDRTASAQAMSQFEQLRNAPYAVTYSQAYLEQGRYAEAIASTGAERDLVDTATPPVTFTDATAAMLPDAPPGSVTLADIDGDGRLDLLAAGAAVGPAVRAFHNDGTRLVDVTPTLGPTPSRATRIVAADVNNDGRVDLLALTASGPRLLTRQDGGRYRDVTPAVFSASRDPRSQAAALADIDHDGDLDVIAGGRLFRNNGNSTFADVTSAANVRLPPGATAVIPTDFDNRRDVDLLASADGTRPVLFRNLRTGTFEDVAAAVGLPAATDVSAVVTGDVNTDGFTDVFFGRSDAPGVWALSDSRGRFQTRDAPAGTAAALAAQLLDYDNDGLLDLMTASHDGLHLFRNIGGDWQPQDNAVAASRHARIAEGVVPSIASGDLDGDGDIDLVVEDGGIRVWRNDGGNTRRAVRVALTGRASNRHGVGAKVEVRAGSLYTRIETAATTPAVMPADTLFGLGTRADADAVRVLWPSGILQTETPSASATRVAIAELDRKPSSCPFLYTWDGERFTFVTDFMGGGEMGYLESPGVYNVPDPDEYVRITDRQLRERNGRYELRVTNELEEVLYVDHLELMAVTHYPDVEIFPDEGMRVHPPPFRLHAVRNLRPLAAATDDLGRDVLPDLSAIDRQFATGFPLEPVRGYARPHGITMRVPPPGGIQAGMRDPGSGIRSAGARTVLLLTGWTDYAFSTDNIAASQSKLTLTPPALEAQSADGTWRTIIADAGIPVGRPQTLVLDVTEYAARQLRLVTSMRVYWDRIAVADLDVVSPRPVVLAPRAAELRWRGFSAEVSPDGREPYGYDYARVTAGSPWKLMPGRYTREGDVGELLQAVDDRFVISRPGDEISLSFDASALPPLPAGLRRTFLLYASGYSKEMDLHSASPDAVAPIPFRAMPHYPYAWPVRYPHEADLERFHTRTVGRAVPALLTRPTER